MADTDLRLLNELPNGFDRRAEIEAAVREAFRGIDGGRWLVEIRLAMKKNRVVLDVTPPGSPSTVAVTIATWEKAEGIRERLKAAAGLEAIGG